MQKITKVPMAQDYFAGIINLRGEIVPVMSIRTKMGLDEDVFTNKSRIIILKVEGRGNLGIIVDEVREVITLSEDDIEKVSKSGAAHRSKKESFINGIGKNGEELISLFDINDIIGEKENP